MTRRMCGATSVPVNPLLSKSDRARPSNLREVARRRGRGADFSNASIAAAILTLASPCFRRGPQGANVLYDRPYLVIAQTVAPRFHEEVRRDSVMNDRKLLGVALGVRITSLREIPRRLTPLGGRSTSTRRPVTRRAVMGERFLTGRQRLGGRCPLSDAVRTLPPACPNTRTRRWRVRDCLYSHQEAD